MDTASHRSDCNCNCTMPAAEDEFLVLQENTLEVVEQKLFLDFRLWHVLFMGFASVMAVVICVCCCFRFRIPRTKQEIEADYVRKKITRKFQKQLQLIQNAEMDEMDLKRALERVRAEFKSDAESLAHSEPPSSSSGPQDDSVFRKSSTDIGVSIDDLIHKENKGLGSKFASFVGILRPRKTQPSPDNSDNSPKMRV